MIDEGIKQIPSYKCTIPFDELKELREKFWQSKIKQHRRWKAIREICEADAPTAVQLLEAAGFACKDNLRLIMEIENFDIVYKVPNFCIADPVFERDYNIFLNKDNYTTKDLNIVLYSSITNKETKLTVNNKMSGRELKEIFAKEENVLLDKYSIRLFYSGQEVKDDHLLYYHSSLDNNSKLQVICIKKE